MYGCLSSVRMLAFVHVVLQNLVRIDSVTKCSGHGHAVVCWVWLFLLCPKYCLFVAYYGVPCLVFVRWPWKPMILLTVEWNAFPFLFAERRLRRLDFLLLLNHCNECRSIVVVVLVVMLTGYLPENASRAFNMLI